MVSGSGTEETAASIELGAVDDDGGRTNGRGEGAGVGMIASVVVGNSAGEAMCFLRDTVYRYVKSNIARGVPCLETVYCREAF